MGSPNGDEQAPGSFCDRVRSWMRRQDTLFILPALLPQIMISILFCMRGVLGPSGLEYFAVALAGLGATYAALAFPVLVLAALRRPPLVACCGAAGLANVRNLHEAYQNEPGPDL